MLYGFLLNKNSVNVNFVIVAGKRIGFFRFMMVNKDS